MSYDVTRVNVPISYKQSSNESDERQCCTISILVPQISSTAESHSTKYTQHRSAENCLFTERNCHRQVPLSQLKLYVVQVENGISSDSNNTRKICEDLRLPVQELHFRSPTSARPEVDYGLRRFSIRECSIRM